MALNRTGLGWKEGRDKVAVIVGTTWQLADKWFRATVRCGCGLNWVVAVHELDVQVTAATGKAQGGSRPGGWLRWLGWLVAAVLVGGGWDDLRRLPGVNVGRAGLGWDVQPQEERDKVAYDLAVGGGSWPGGWGGLWLIKVV